MGFADDDIWLPACCWDAPEIIPDRIVTGLRNFFMVHSDKQVRDFLFQNRLFSKTKKKRKEMLNKTMLIGRLGRDPETRYSKDGLAITSFSIATTLAWKDKTTGEKKETTEWHRIVAFGKLAEICSEYLSKGKLIYVEGRLHTRSWEQDGITRYITEIVMSNMHTFGTKEPNENGPAETNSNHNPPPAGEPFPMDDDIPF